MKSGKDLILEALKERSATKQEVYQITKQCFSDFKRLLVEVYNELNEEAAKIDSRIEIRFNDVGDYEAELKFSGDVLIFTMHSNIFNFDENHDVHKSAYVKEDDTRSYCGMIQIHNFLADSLRFNRKTDIGYLIARVFINKDKHFFVEGKRQLGFLYNDFENAVINDVYIKAIIESSILFSLDFDLLVPPFEVIKEISVDDMRYLASNAGFKTAKRLGYQFAGMNE